MGVWGFLVVVLCVYVCMGFFNWVVRGFFVGGWVLVVVLGRFFCEVVCFLEEYIYEMTVDQRS